MEGGLSVSYEKLITDIEALQTIAELFQPTPGDTDAIGYDAIAEVQPGGHFFAAAHTMARYRTAFYQPLVADLSNFGNWTESGSKTATERANGIWKRVIDEYKPIDRAGEIDAALDGFVLKRMSEGGAEAVS
jgi:trimethylamine--corrinoid protein Co-methyltransferase